MRYLSSDNTIDEWVVATDRAIAALKKFKTALQGWKEDGHHSPTVDAAVARLDHAGLSEWAEWGAGLELDHLQLVVEGETRNDSDDFE